MIYFLTGNAAQTQWLANDLGFPRDIYRHLFEAHQLEGTHQPIVIVSGTADQRRDYGKILDMMESRDALFWGAWELMP